MSDATLRTAIKALMQAVPGAGNIHDYERWAVDPSAFIAMFKDPATGKIAGWEITRTAVPKVDVLGTKYKITNTYQLQGYYGLQDAAASEKSFAAIVDAILMKFISNRIAGASLHTLPRGNVIQARMFGGILCHYAEITIDVPEVVAPTSDEAVDVDCLSMGINYYLQTEHPVTGNVIDASDEITFGE